MSRCTPAGDRPRSDRLVWRRGLLTLLAYVETGSHKAAADRMGISESACRQRISYVITQVQARNAAQAAWLLREALEAEQRRSR